MRGNSLEQFYKLFPFATRAHDHVIRTAPRTAPSSTIMPDPRFTRLRSDPRFRSLKRHKNKVTVDSRFSSVFSRAKKKSQIGEDYLFLCKPSLTQRCAQTSMAAGCPARKKMKIYVGFTVLTRRTGTNSLLVLTMPVAKCFFNPPMRRRKAGVI